MSLFVRFKFFLNTAVIALGLNIVGGTAYGFEHEPLPLLQRYCFDCHDEETKSGGLDLIDMVESGDFDGYLMFENLITGKMPPANKRQPSVEEKRALLEWLAQCQEENAPNSFRRISRHEFVHSVNDLLGTNLDLADTIPEDRGTNDFDSDRRIQLSREMLGAYFTVADQMLDYAFPENGFPPEQTWVTNKVKDSHETYRIYLRPYREGLLFSWTRANNGNSYSFFYDNFDPPVSGWYELTFDAMKVGEFEEDVSLQVHAGKYYYADDRPQPQRLLEVISLGNREQKAHTIRAFLNPGENVSVHCYSRHTYREKTPQQGAYVKQLKVRGPVYDDPAKSKVTLTLNSRDDLNTAIRRFAEKVFSSNLSEEELVPYLNASLDHSAEHGEFTQATKAGLKAIICSPRFLMAPGEHANPSYSTAADVARVLWLSIPDEELLRLSRSGELSGDTLRAQIDRMLGDKKNQRMIHSFCDQWLSLRSLNKVTPSLKLYPKYDDLLNHYLPIETQAYLSHLIQENLPVGNLIDSDFSFLNQRLAQHYGIDGIVGQEMRKVTFPPEVPRGGLLTMGSVLKVTTDGYDSSPILRGAWISKNIVGTPLSPPPENVKAIEPDHGEEAATLREQIEQHKNSKTCYACHKSIDPYGFALESFDATGQWRDRYRVKLPHDGTFQYRQQGYYRMGGEVDASGAIGRKKFDDIFGLKKVLLADHRKIAYNFAKKFFEYANGYKPSLKQRLVLLDIIEDNPQDCRVKELITEVLVYSLTGEQK